MALHPFSRTRRCRLTAGLLLVLASITPAAAASWQVGKDEGGAPTLIASEDDSGESVVFSAVCAKGSIAAMFAAPDRAKITGGKSKACGGDRPCRENLPVSVQVDGKGMDFVASAQPEEMYGGYEIHVTLDPKAPLWDALKTGKQVSLKMDGKVGEKLALKGSRPSITAFLSACAK